jgi:hypothetical protein
MEVKMLSDTTNVIDFISTQEDFVWLTIADELDWQEESNHLILLQDKVNAYLEFIENGQLFETYPDANSCKIGIEICAKHTIPKIGLDFLMKIKDLLENSGYEFRYEITG